MKYKVLVHITVGAGRDVKDYLVLTPLLWAGITQPNLKQKKEKKQPPKSVNYIKSATRYPY